MLMKVCLHAIARKSKNLGMTSWPIEHQVKSFRRDLHQYVKVAMVTTFHGTVDWRTSKSKVMQ